MSINAKLNNQSANATAAAAATNQKAQAAERQALAARIALVAECEANIVNHATKRAESGMGYAGLFLELAKTARAAGLKQDSFDVRLSTLQEEVKKAYAIDWNTIAPYMSQARRIVAATPEAYEAALRAGHKTLKTIAEALPKVTGRGRKVEGAAGKDSAEPAAPPSNVVPMPGAAAPSVTGVLANIEAQLKLLSKVAGDDADVAALLVQVSDVLGMIGERLTDKEPLL